MTPRAFDPPIVSGVRGPFTAARNSFQSASPHPGRRQCLREAALGRGRPPIVADAVADKLKATWNASFARSGRRKAYAVAAPAGPTAEAFAEKMGREGAAAHERSMPKARRSRGRGGSAQARMRSACSLRARAHHIGAGSPRWLARSAGLAAHRAAMLAQASRSWTPSSCEGPQRRSTRAKQPWSRRRPAPSALAQAREEQWCAPAPRTARVAWAARRRAPCAWRGVLRLWRARWLPLRRRLSACARARGALGRGGCGPRLDAWPGDGPGSHKPARRRAGRSDGCAGACEGRPGRRHGGGHRDLGRRDRDTGQPRRPAGGRS